jgi:hypothetical protein
LLACSSFVFLGREFFSWEEVSQGLYLYRKGARKKRGEELGRERKFEKVSGAWEASRELRDKLRDSEGRKRGRPAPKLRASFLGDLGREGREAPRKRGSNRARERLKLRELSCCKRKTCCKEESKGRKFRARAREGNSEEGREGGRARELGQEGELAARKALAARARGRELAKDYKRKSSLPGREESSESFESLAS